MLEQHWLAEENKIRLVYLYKMEQATNMAVEILNVPGKTDETG